RHDLAVGLDDEVVGLVIAAGEVGGDLAVKTEARIQVAVGEVTCHGEVGAAAAAGGTAHHHDLVVRLEGDGPTLVGGNGEAGGGLAADTEAQVQSAGVQQGPVFQSLKGPGADRRRAARGPAAGTPCRWASKPGCPLGDRREEPHHRESPSEDWTVGRIGNPSYGPKTGRLIPP